MSGKTEQSRLADLPREAEELTPDQAGAAEGGVLIALRSWSTNGITDGTSNTVMLGESQPTTQIQDGTSNTLMMAEKSG
jgi:hypothetical protein